MISKPVRDQTHLGESLSATTNLKWRLLYFGGLVEWDRQIFSRVQSQSTVASCDSEGLSGWVRQRAICGLFSCQMEARRGSVASIVRVKLGFPPYYWTGHKMSFFKWGTDGWMLAGWRDGRKAAWRDDGEQEKVQIQDVCTPPSLRGANRIL